MNIQVLGFDWDEGNQEKCQKHGLTLADIEAFFHQESIFVAPDLQHSQLEQRYLAIGLSQTQRPMFVVFTLRDQGDGSLIRPISARYMHQREARRYEEIFTTF